jgi:hypothetical protein
MLDFRDWLNRVDATVGYDIRKMRHLNYWKWTFGKGRTPQQAADIFLQTEVTAS